MINGERILAIIPARGGSKGVPGKNIRPLAGKPLLAWTIEEAKKSRYIDRLVLSSEDSEIIEAARKYGCDVPFIRPKKLALDQSSNAEVILHSLQHLDGYDWVMQLQPTSPFRSANDIDQCIEYCIKKKADACLSVTETEKSPFWMYFMDQEAKLKKVIDSNKIAMNRQELPDVFSVNGAIYLAKCNWFKRNKSFLSKETIGFKMPKERSLDIDTEWDFRLAALIKNDQNLGEE
ncbi:acylneuraminate cytidylyltransferase family protein [Metabacillus idriensis]|uniref:Acylneuraminate cytidylyltransferase family protein n=1 Tax=Metabacillus idriensis TaxID=324768 RepID=A0A6I2MAD0_9BACI|nr:acylneuraminate cytidylyltransferase family protein [Metabacillus idriensis]MCM3596562.1 acylneuraminate cytidylyltransferase family protein [Metabacillus idriensis]MRX55355.1 acylneuraminate cytidylyltransferase family protein [Metabacillus idriensis]OHR68135.1 acylneuraminate cytidylyltransferase [Bacillus sp. HMSC76G11]